MSDQADWVKPGRLFVPPGRFLFSASRRSPEREPHRDHRAKCHRLIVSHPGIELPFIQRIDRRFGKVRMRRINDFDSVHPAIGKDSKHGFHYAFTSLGLQRGGI